MAEIAAALKLAVEQRVATGTAGATKPRRLAQGAGWSVADVVCTLGPCDRPFVEEHRSTCIAVVGAGSFQYRSSRASVLLAPGSLMLGNAGERFECRHAHAMGDRCLSFSYTPGYFECLAADAATASELRVASLPPVRALSPAVAHALAGLTRGEASAPTWEELGVWIAVEALRLANGNSRPAWAAPPSAEARVTRVVRLMEEAPEAQHSLAVLADAARLSPYHFLRTFQRVVGLTPHQYGLRLRLRRAAVRLVRDTANVLDVALACGFGDVSNFNRHFRAEFGVNPRRFRRAGISGVNREACANPRVFPLPR